MAVTVVALITATNFVPSEDDATLVQYPGGAVVSIQVAPELLDVQIAPP